MSENPVAPLICPACGKPYVLANAEFGKFCWRHPANFTREAMLKQQRDRARDEKLEAAGKLDPLDRAPKYDPDDIPLSTLRFVEAILKYMP